MRDPTHYVPSHAGIWTHRKFARLTRRLGVDELVVCGALHSLWHSASAQTADGVLRGWDTFDLAAGARWKGDAQALADALVAEGWLEMSGDEFVIHDWSEYAGEWREKREARREQYRESKKRKRGDAALVVETADVHGDSCGHEQMSTTKPVETADVHNREEKRGEEKKEDLLVPQKPAHQKAGKARVAQSHASSEAVLADVHAGSGMTYLDRWMRKFPALARSGRLRGQVDVAWDHKARRNHTDMRLYLGKWLTRANDEAEERERRSGSLFAATTRRPDAAQITGPAPLAEGEIAPGVMSPEWLRANGFDGPQDEPSDT